jgi:O-antigen/teichoic acid export membrane protein
MSLRRNIVANYAGQLYVTVAGIVVLPVYVRLMGTEAFGLVGFFTMLQSWFMLLDMGLTPTMARETARFAGGATDGPSLRRLLRSLEGIFALVAVVGAVALIVAADPIARRWLTVDALPIEEVRRALSLMAVIVALRWMTGLYKGAITGFERLVWLNSLGIGMATVRYALVIPLLAFVSNTPTAFFTFQLAVALAEALVIVWKTYTLLPPKGTEAVSAFDLAPLRGVLRFSLTIAFTSAAWVLITQTDKLILSGMIPLGAYAHFTLAVVVASGILQLSGPVSGALLPRLTRLKSAHDDMGVRRVYRGATQLVALITVPAVLVLACFPRQVLWAWTGDAAIADGAAGVLRLYAIGNGLMVLAGFGYYLQYAYGNLRLHLIANITFVLLFLPLLVWAVARFGIQGAGHAWLLANLLPFVAWLPVVHRRFLPGMHLRWLFVDIGHVAALPLAGAFMVARVLPWPAGRVAVAVTAAGVGTALLLGAAVGSSLVREEVSRRLRGAMPVGDA